MRKWHALYYLENGECYWRQFMADSFDHALDQATDACEEGEELMSLVILP